MATSKSKDRLKDSPAIHSVREMQGVLDRVPPQSLEMEQAVLGAMLFDPDAVLKIVEVLKAADFYKRAHQRIYTAILDLFEKSEPVDIVTVSQYLKDLGQLDEAGGRTYISDLAMSVATSAMVEYNAAIIREKSILRQLVHVGTEIVTTAYEETDAEKALDFAEQQVFALAQQGNSTDDMTAIKDILPISYEQIEERYSNKGSLMGVPSGFYDLDHMTSGFQPSDLIIVAARPSMGKTAFCLNIASNISLHEKRPTLFFSLEMSKEQLVQRILCSEAEVDSQRIRTGEIHMQDFTKISQAMSRLGEAPLFIDDSPGVTLMQIRAKARKLKMECGDLGMIIIDYLQLIEGRETSKGGGENRTQEISMISRGLKSVARELKVPVIALSQLSRAVESRTEKKPMLSDLRESGSIEQDADLVMFLYRDEYYTKEATEKPGIASVIIAKQRNGPVGEIELLFRNSITKFLNPAGQHTQIF